MTAMSFIAISLDGVKEQFLSAEGARKDIVAGFAGDPTLKIVLWS
jgi:hypothetical protein